ncbi:MAG: GNA1162 family protein [Myxococcota bacterium]
MKNQLTDRLLAVLLVLACGCATSGTRYQDQAMDFGQIRTVAVVPFVNLSRDAQASDRVRDVVVNMLLATGAFYVLSQGEVARGVTRAAIKDATAPSAEEVAKLGTILSADAVILGVVKEYGEVRAAATAANAISLSLQMQETQTGKVIWSASSTQGGIGFWERLFGGGGEPMNRVTEDAVDDLLDKLFR